MQNSTIRPAGSLRKRIGNMRPARIRRIVAGTATVLLGMALGVRAEPPALPRIARLDGTRITVSGLSSGAAMAVQLGVAYSARVSGVGIIAGPPYLCAGGSLFRAINTCLLLGRATLDRWTGGATDPAACEPRPGKPLDVQGMIEDTVDLAGRGKIDPLAGIAGQKVAEFRGRCDAMVGSSASSAQAAYYRHFGADFQSQTRADISHTMPTDKPDQGDCKNPDKDFVSSCNFDAVGEMLHHLIPGAPAGRSPVMGEWLRFDQARYVDSTQDAEKRLQDISLAREGQVFVPAICVSQPCRLHVALHGCLQGIEDGVFDNFVRQSGYAEWASSIGLVVLFPRVTALKAFDRGFDLIGNPAGCWDWWGYTNSGFGNALNYATRDAPQMRAIMTMVGALAGQ